jgi:hypothetical protein
MEKKKVWHTKRKEMGSIDELVEAEEDTKLLLGSMTEMCEDVLAMTTSHRSMLIDLFL